MKNCWLRNLASRFKSNNFYLTLAWRFQFSLTYKLSNWAVNVKVRFSNLEYRWFSKCVGFLAAKSWENLKIGENFLKPIIQLKLCIRFFGLGPNFRALGPKITKKQSELEIAKNRHLQIFEKIDRIPLSLKVTFDPKWRMSKIGHFFDQSWRNEFLAYGNGRYGIWKLSI